MMWRSRKRRHKIADGFGSEIGRHVEDQVLIAEQADLLQVLNGRNGECPETSGCCCVSGQSASQRNDGVGTTVALKE